MTSELRVDRIIPTTGVPTGGGGGIVQTVFAENNTIQSFAFNNQNFSPQTVCSASITPRSITNKILVYCSAGVFANGQTAQNYEFSLHLKRGNSLIGGNTQPTQFKGTNVLFSGVNSPESASTGTFFYLDSPSTTNSITYNLCLQGGESITYGVGRSYNDAPSTLYNYQNSPGTSIILLEVSA